VSFVCAVCMFREVFGVDILHKGAQRAQRGPAGERGLLGERGSAGERGLIGERGHAVERGLLGDWHGPMLVEAAHIPRAPMHF